MARLEIRPLTDESGLEAVADGELAGYLIDVERYPVSCTRQAPLVFSHTPIPSFEETRA